VRLRPGWLLGAALLATLLASGIGAVLSYAVLHDVRAAPAPVAPTEAAAPAQGTAEADDEFLRQNIEALAVRLGELQARLARLDAIGDRLGGMVGIRTQELQQPVPGRGGAPGADVQQASLEELSSAVEQIALGVERRGDHLSLLESELVLRDVMAWLLPSIDPLPDGLPGSRFGWRRDPFSGRRAMHEGIDFNAPHGTPIVAAGAGVVVFSGWHPAYGRQVDIDHGSGMVTRYAHASRLLVKQGDIVRRGQRIALVGSSGRSTGAHLHFEVRVDGEPRDPLAFLRQSTFAGRLGTGQLAGAAGGAVGR
jgi:murein DD-endopeptidase MepM/ murein hydrolase activator NlpD